MKLIIVLNGRTFIEWEVSNTVTLQEIKHYIHICRGIPISSQTLSHNGNTIATDADLRAADLTDGSRITLRIEKPLESRINQIAHRITQLFASPKFDFSSFNQFMNAAEASSCQPPPSQFPFPDATQPPPRKSFITLKYSDPFSNIVDNIEATDKETVLQLKLMIQDVAYFPIGQIVIKDHCGNELIDAMTLLHPQNPDQPEFYVEILPPAPPLSLFQSSEFNTTVDESMNADRDSTQPLPEKVCIAVKMLSSFNVTYNIEATNETILELKLAIQNVKKIPIGQIVMKDQYGYELLDAMTLLQSQNPEKTELIVEFLRPSPSHPVLQKMK